MSIRVNTEIKKTISSIVESELLIKNTIQAVTSDNPNITTDDLNVDHVDVKTWNLTVTQGTSFSLDILTLLNVVTLSSELKFLHIQCHRLVKSDRAAITPYRFTLVSDQGSIGNVSQFTLANIDTFGFTTLTVSNVVIPANEEATLTVVFGINRP